MTFSAMTPFKPFSKKQREYILAARDNTFNFAEGAVRSGKTICNVVAFALALNKSPDKLHLATGVTLAAACLNMETVTDSDWNIYSGEGVVGENLKIILVFL